MEYILKITYNFKICTLNEALKMNEKIKDFKSSFYGVIHNIKNNTEIEARIYNLEDNELVDDIIFYISEFSIPDQKLVGENVVFLWTVGSNNDNHYSTFEIKKRTPLTKEQQIKKENDIKETIDFFRKLKNEDK